MRRVPHVVGDVAALPGHSFGPTSLGWWGVLGFVLIEGAGFVLAIGAYYFLVHNESQWPPTGAPPPLAWAAAFALLAVLTELPNAWLKRAAKACDLRRVRAGLVLMTALGVVLLAVRAFELHALDVRWDQTAYGSIVWALLALHTFHLVTDVYDSGVLAALAWSRPMDGRRHSDVADNAMYWHFIVWSGVAIHGVIYWTPRWL